MKKMLLILAVTFSCSCWAASKKEKTIKVTKENIPVLISAKGKSQEDIDFINELARTGTKKQLQDSYLHHTNLWFGFSNVLKDQKKIDECLVPHNKCRTEELGQKEMTKEEYIAFLHEAVSHSKKMMDYATAALDTQQLLSVLEKAKPI